MTSIDKIKLSLALIVIAMISVVCASGSGESLIPAAAPLTASIKELSGQVQILKFSEGFFKDASLNSSLEENDQVLTGEDGRVRLDLDTGTIIRIGPFSNFTLKQNEDTPQGTLTTLELTIGRIWIILNGGSVEVDTPSGMASVRGSYLHVWVDPDNGQTRVTCLEGDCALSNASGTVALVAGQTAEIKGNFDPPQADKMSDEDVNEWLDMNPEATLVIVPLTATVAAAANQPLPQANTNTPTPTGLTGSKTPTSTYTPTGAMSDAECGPPLGWVLHTVQSGETLEILATRYRVSVEDLQTANCRGDLTFVATGEKLYVPNVATSTPAKTATPTATKTAIFTTQAPSNTPGGPTATIGKTATPTNSPTTLSDPVGPDKTVIGSGDTCDYSYKITAKDADGIAEVKLIYTFDGSLPMRGTAINDGYYKLLGKLTNESDYRYGVESYLIDTSGESIPVTIQFRFAAMDTRGNVTYFPADKAYTLTDNQGCPVAAPTPTNTPVPSNTPVPTNSPTIFTSMTGPGIGSALEIIDPAYCEQTYTVNVTDEDGLSVVKLLYNVDGTPLNWDDAVASGEYYTMSASGSVYSVTTTIDSSVGSSNTVKYVFAAQDDRGDVTLSPTVYSFTDTIDCGITTSANETMPSGTIDACPKLYQLDVFDANGIAKVEVVYTIFDGTNPDGNGSFEIPLDDGDTYKTYQVVDTSGFLTGATVNYKVYAKDSRGTWTTSPLYSGSFIDNVICTP